MAGTKGIAIGCIAVVILVAAVVVCGVGGIFWLGLGSMADKFEKDGAEFGKRTDQRGCRDEAFRRLHAALRNYDVVGRRGVQLFAYGCFQTCRATPEFCATVPRDDDHSSRLRWAEAQCQIEGLGHDDACQDLLMEVSDACLGKTPRRAN
jgi:hypothetical protein